MFLNVACFCLVFDSFNMDLPPSYRLGNDGDAGLEGKSNVNEGIHSRSYRTIATKKYLYIKIKQ